MSDDQKGLGRKLVEIGVRDIKKEYEYLRSYCFIYGKGQNFYVPSGLKMDTINSRGYKKWIQAFSTKHEKGLFHL